MTEFTKKYKDLVSSILEFGEEQECRNGSQLILPHYSFTLNHSNYENHELKLRKMFYKGVKGEFGTLIDEKLVTNVSQFEANGCNYWKLWGNENGNINIDYSNKMQPQLNDIIELIKADPTSRRLHVELWDHFNVQNNFLSLPCCWHGLTFSVINNTLHLKWTQRSVDTMLGLPADVYLSYLFMEYVANLCDLQIGTCMYSLSNVHVYLEHVEDANVLLQRTEDDWNLPLKFELKA